LRVVETERDIRGRVAMLGVEHRKCPYPDFPLFGESNGRFLWK
jgi:hypothetical protein